MKLSVIVVTYNHEKYIRQAIESILNQKVDFQYKIIIADDASTDKTPQIIKEFQKNYPDKIFPIFNEKNLGVLKNVLNIMKHIQTDFIAFLDGDDYWTHEFKLQKQIDFLESNIDFNGCFHDAEIEHIDEANKLLFNSGHKYSDHYKYRQELYTGDLINRLIIPTSGLVLRSWFLYKLDTNVLKDNYSVLWKLTCLAIKDSKLYYIDEIWSKYRNHPKGLSKSHNVDFHLSHADFLESIASLRGFEKNYYDIFVAASNEYRLALQRIDKKEKGALKIFMHYLWCELKKNHAFYKHLFK